MSAAAGLVLAIILLAISFLHLLWGLGIWFPGGDERALARMVVGAPGIGGMPPAPAAFAVALGLSVGAVWAAVLGGWLPNFLPDRLRGLGGSAFAVLFILRGLAGYTAIWARLWPEQPFRRLDRLSYSPLCLLLGVGFVVLLRQ